MQQQLQCNYVPLYQVVLNKTGKLSLIRRMRDFNAQPLKAAKMLKVRLPCAVHPSSSQCHPVGFYHAVDIRP